MNSFVKIILLIFAFAYFITPFDLIPDFLIPFIGWFDDTFIIGIVIYLIRYGRLPKFSGKFSKFFKLFSNRLNPNKNQYSNGFSHFTNKDKANNNNSTKTIDPYKILGLQKDAKKKEIHTAFKQKAQQYHPDKVSHLGEELQKIANEKFIEIKKAHDTLMK